MIFEPFISMTNKPYLIIVTLVVAIFVAIIIFDKKRVADAEDSTASKSSTGDGIEAFSDEDSESAARSTKHKPRESTDKPKKTRTASGLIYEVMRKGNGVSPGPTDKVKVLYLGYLPDGTEFDRSRGGKPISFLLNGVIPGWAEGLQLMKVGAKYRFTIPPELAYGQSGAGNVIGPNQTLIFEVELVEVDQ